MQVDTPKVAILIGRYELRNKDALHAEIKICKLNRRIPIRCIFAANIFRRPAPASCNFPNIEELVSEFT